MGQEFKLLYQNFSNLFYATVLQNLTGARTQVWPHLQKNRAYMLHAEFLLC